MAELTAGAALRLLQQAQAGMKRARQALRLARPAGALQEPALDVLRTGWDSLAQAHKILATIPLTAATDAVLTKQLAVQRYATALLVRLRRLARNEPGAIDRAEDEDFDDEA